MLWSPFVALAAFCVACRYGTRINALVYVLFLVGAVFCDRLPFRGVCGCDSCSSAIVFFQGWALAASVSIDYLVYCSENQCTGLHQYTGRALLGQQASPAREGGALKAPLEAKKYAFSLHLPSQSGLKSVMAGGGCGHLRRKNQGVKRNSCNVWR